MFLFKCEGLTQILALIVLGCCSCQRGTLFYIPSGGWELCLIRVIARKKVMFQRITSSWCFMGFLYFAGSLRLTVFQTIRPALTNLNTCRTELL